MATLKQDFLIKAAALDRAHMAAVDALRRREDLSSVGKQAEFEKLETRRKQQVQSLQDEARQALSAERERVQKALAKERGAQEQAMRELLGPAVMLELVRERLKLQSPKQIETDAKETQDAWLRAVFVEFGNLELERRVVASHGQDVDASIAQREIRSLAPSLSPAVQALQTQADELRDVDAVVQSLDGMATRQSIAGVIPVSSRHVDPYVGLVPA